MMQISYMAVFKFELYEIELKLKSFSGLREMREQMRTMCFFFNRTYMQFLTAMKIVSVYVMVSGCLSLRLAVTES